jgi:hypothetical protein
MPSDEKKKHHTFAMAPGTRRRQIPPPRHLAEKKNKTIGSVWVTQRKVKSFVFIQIVYIMCQISM